ncbi:ABC-type phosphate transport system, periplasmic component [Thermococcus kodakarensis KOD1]|uniref:Phosphate-binding protein n=1 Tax=Thermococcus kodakarensis (strain ATCC BAA-918 / JCM 12380 / KOD1) TaxID=69014 RepID=Q5JEL9_THEKO|nr:phosphate ABC transporter substrate-binding protein PstS [Thermococcus kodakarensis]WCN29401.1 phosphate ABC transporter substrate-binding protein PstS [Thermococcus kodakarensis]WCN30061.1 phosphate ABC transporter substrate-binding protein PstS [Thermococcus kodakarensis]BAD86053.1 ABC-type phosphate transport system, periplasmic component [Thermococcus kodakarensis KOD1]
MKKAISVFIVLLLGLSLVASGCISSEKSPSTSPSSTARASSQGTSQTKVITIRTTGATFPQYQIQKWIEIYMKSHPNVKIEYEGGGSGHGQEAFLKGLTHIGRTDPPVKESTWKKFLATGDQPLQFPEIVGAVVVAFNVPGVDELKLDGETLAKIFMGEIEYWDDDAIKAFNPSANLPHEKIIVVHRSDSSGTTAIFTTYLSLVNKEWADKVGAGKTVDWPVDKVGRGIGGKGNPGVVQALKNTKYSIAYTELSFAIEENLKVVALKNKAGNFVKPTDDAIKAAVAGVKAFIPSPTEGYKEDLNQLLNAPGENSYPIVAFTHLLVWQNKGGKHYSKEEVQAIKEFLRWVLTEGQKPENLAPGYVGLPPEVAKIGLQAVDMIEG